jgi:uncharacterized membrane protein
MSNKKHQFGTRSAPMAEVTSTNWTLDEAMRFVITAGTTAPNTITFLKNINLRGKPAQARG